MNEGAISQHTNRVLPVSIIKGSEIHEALRASKTQLDELYQANVPLQRDIRSVGSSLATIYNTIIDHLEDEGLEETDLHSEDMRLLRETNNCLKAALSVHGHHKDSLGITRPVRNQKARSQVWLALRLIESMVEAYKPVER